MDVWYFTCYVAYCASEKNVRTNFQVFIPNSEFRTFPTTFVFFPFIVPCLLAWMREPLLKPERWKSHLRKCDEPVRRDMERLCKVGVEYLKFSDEITKEPPLNLGSPLEIF